MKKLNTFIAPEILDRLTLNTRISAVLSECLPGDFAAHTECIGIREQTLNLATDSSARSNQLRFYSDEMLTRLHAQGLTNVTCIKITTKIATGEIRKAPRHQNCAQLSNASRKLLASGARDIDDERLRAALLRLAGAGKDE